MRLDQVRQIGKIGRKDRQERQIGKTDRKDRGGEERIDRQDRKVGQIDRQIDRQIGQMVRLDETRLDLDQIVLG